MMTAATLFAKEAGISNLLQSLVQHSRVLLLYFVPSAMYGVYNNLAFTNLASYDPTTYYLLLQVGHFH